MSQEAHLSSVESALPPDVRKYYPYFVEVKTKAIKVLLVFLVSSILGFLFYQPILARIMGLFQLKGINVVLTSPTQFIDLAIETGLVTGIVVTLPLLIYYALQFVRPGLKPKEYELIKKLLPFSLGLFILGFAFGIWVEQFVINIFSQTTTQFALQNIWDIEHFLGQVLIMGLSLGLAFQLPILLTLGLKLKIIRREQVTKQRKFVWAGCLIFAAVMPPTDIFSMAILTIVPLLLFEIALFFNRS